MERRVPDYNNQADYDERLRNRYRWGLAYGVSLVAGVALAFFVVRGESQFLLPAEVAFLVNMSLLVFAMVNQYRLPPYHLPGEKGNAGINLQFFRLFVIIILLAPFSLSLGYLLDLTMGPQWFQVGVLLFFADFGLAVVLLVLGSRYPSSEP